MLGFHLWDVRVRDMIKAWPTRILSFRRKKGGKEGGGT